MRVLAVDIGTVNFGWAHGSAGEKPSHGVYNPPSTRKNIGWLLADIRAWLVRMTESHGPTHIVFATPVLVHHNNVWTIRKMNAIAGLLELHAYDYQMTVEEKSESEVRRNFLAPHKVPRTSPAIKAAVVARCRQLGWSPEMDDDADAMALLDYTLAIKGSRLARIGEMAL